MMDEVAAIRVPVDPSDVILVADARAGQDAVHVAEEFNARVPLSRVWEAGARWTFVVRTGLCCGGPPSPRTGVTSSHATG